MSLKLHGLVAATHTPFDNDGEVNLTIVEKQAEHLARSGVGAVFVAGSTGECHSLSVEERLALGKRWSEVVRGSTLRLVIHVGANCLADARTLAAQAQSVGAAAISALAPSYFKPRTLEALVASSQHVAEAAPALPFYFYDIPSMTGVHLPMPDFLAMAADRIPTLAGIKFSNPDLMAYQRCLHTHEGRFDMPWGTDEYLLAALAVGAQGGVGSSYNFAAPLYNRILKSFAAGDLTSARTDQFRSVRLIHLLASYGYSPASKALMKMLGVDVGAPRLPIPRLAVEDVSRLEAALGEIGFFDSTTFGNF